MGSKRLEIIIIITIWRQFRLVFLHSWHEGRAHLLVQNQRVIMCFFGLKLHFTWIYLLRVEVFVIVIYNFIV